MTYEEAKNNHKANCDKTAFNLMDIDKVQLSKAIELTPKVIEVLEKFDGKVYNIRLEKALKEIDNGISLDWGYNTIKITYIDWNHRSTKDLNSECGWVYVNKTSYPLFYTDSSELVGKDKRIHLTDKARDDIQKWLQSNKSHLEKLEGITMETINGWRDRLKKIKEMAEELNREVPSECRDYFSLRTYAQWN